MRILKVLLNSALLASAFLPWNATAIDHVDLSKQVGIFGTNKFSPNYTENLLVKSLLEITQGKTQQALDTLDQLIRDMPNFKLAYLVRGDLLMAKAQRQPSFGNASMGAPDKISDFRAEARMRIEHYLSQQNAANKIPEPIWQLDASQKNVIIVDADKSRLYLYRNQGGSPEYVTDYYVTVGKNGYEKSTEGDKRTPLGIYSASGKLDRKLPDFYGDAAYPLNYPNEWDKHQGKNGHGIWLHGTPASTYSRPPRASDGCVVLTNPDLKSLAPILQTGKTLVIIANNLQWLDAKQASMQKNDLSKAIDHWRKDWESQNTDSYLAHYSDKFFTQTSDLSTWSKDKRRIQATKSQIEIKLSNMSMFRYPNSQFTMVAVNFDQDYKSNNLDSKMRKRQLWILENQRWKIIYEGAA
ncbi:MAG: murein L,D-transpeptidase family protein [Methylophilaceae bacterium]